MHIIILVCLSVTGGQRKRFDPEIQEPVYLAIKRKLELGDLCVVVMVLATGTNSSVLDRLYKK